MNRTIRRTIAFFGIVALTACSSGSMGRTSLPQSPAFGSESGVVPLAAPNAIRQVCANTIAFDEMRCFALERTDLRSYRPGVIPEASLPKGYRPADLQAAYNVTTQSSGKGNGVTVAIVDAFGYPNASPDLAIYRKQFGLPACTKGNGCLKIVNQNGGSSLPPPRLDWEFEQALDLDMVSAMCPNCKILLVEASKATGAKLYTGVATAANMGAVAISNSYGGSEKPTGAPCFGGGSASDSHFAATGHVYVASAGDSGGGLKDCGGPAQPSTLPTVVCVGGTHLVHNSSARGWGETVWDFNTTVCGSQGCGATGSACSYYVPKPAWQTDSGCKMRSAADVSAVADPLTPVLMYTSVGGYGWVGVGGTSASAPIVAGIYAIAGNATSINAPKKLWADAGSHLYDVIKGNNIKSSISGPCASSVSYICTARAGYDGPTGWGTPNGVGAF